MRKNPVDQSRLAAQVILNVRSGRATSRRGLAEALSVSPSTTGLYVDELVKAGLLRETGLEQGKMGRPKRRLSTVPGAGWFAGLEFHAGRVQAARVDFSGRLIHSQSFALPANPTTRTVMEQLREAVAWLAGRSPGRMLAIGVGAPGVVDPKNGTGLHYSFIEDWRDVPVVEELGFEFGVRVTLENNLRVIALAERWFGDGGGLANYIVLGPRRGFGVAIVNEGQLLGGAHQAAGEVGNWWWPAGGAMREMHDELSAPAVWRRLAGAAETEKLPADLHQALALVARNSAREEVVRDFAKVTGWLQLLLDTEAFILHGPLTALGDSFWNEVSEETARLMPRLAARQPRITCSSLTDNAGALGAASLAMEAWQPSS